MKTLQIAKTATLAVIMLMLAAGVALAKGEVKVVAVSGSVEFQAGSTGGWKALKKGNALSQGDKIKTGANSTAVLRWFEDNSVKLSPLTLVSITQLVKSGKTEKSELNMEKGKMHVKAKKLSTQDSAFYLKTPVARAGVRGTEFTAEQIAGGEAIFIVLVGSIIVEAQEITRILEAEYYVIVEDTQAPGDALEITDEMLNEIRQDSEEMDEVLESSDQPEGDVPEVVLENIDEVTDFLGDEILELDTDNLIIENLSGSGGSCCSY